MTPPDPTRRVLFICTHNAGRSIVAAVVTALTERGISLTGVHPKAVTPELLASADLVVTMSRHPTGPTLPRDAARHSHWQLDFPGDDLDAMRAFCDHVDQRTRALLASPVWPGGPLHL
jgi:protein-tyrosine-phosphatase